LLHGTSASLQTWDGWVSALKTEHRVIRVDLPGFGLTGPTPDGDYGMAGYTRFVADLLNQLHVERAIVAGNSFGGYIAWKTAVDYPDRIRKLVLIDAGGYAYQPKSMPIGFKLAQIPVLAPLMTKLMTRALIESSVRNVYGDPSKITPALIERYYELALRPGNRAAVVERFRQARGGEFEAQIKTVQTPTLILWGAEDRLIPPENGQRFAKDIVGSRLTILEGLGHVPHEEDPTSTVAAARAFLSAP
jgi:pimeloyl-ACP methyl ester carboxylesterase